MSPSFDNLVDLASASFTKYRERPAFGTKRGDQWHWATYGELWELVDRCRGGLAELGVRLGDHVAIIANNCLEWPVACYATYGLGGVFVPMYETQLPSEWQFILRDCGAKVVIVTTEAMLETIERMRPGLPAIEHVIALRLPEPDPRSFATLLRRGAARPAAARHPSPEETAGLIYTSGTTGDPKGVILSHGNIASNINALRKVFELSPEDRSLAFLPWAHAYGQTCEVHALISMGASTAINDELPHLPANLAEVKPTILVAVPRIFNKIHAAVRHDIAERPAMIRRLFESALAAALRRSHGETLTTGQAAMLRIADGLIFAKIRRRFGGRLRYAVSGGAALNHEVAEFIDAIGIPFYEGYGLTETSPMVAVNAPGRRRLGSVGIPLPGVRVLIDPTPGDGAPGQGEIVVFGPNVMVGYHGRPDETAKSLRPDGGFRTGDTGYLDADGYLYVTGRIKEQFKLENGKFVMPSPIEDALRLSPYIAGAMVYGVNRPHTVALIVLDTDAVKRWVEREHVTLGDLESDPRVHELIQGEIEARCTAFKSYERPKDFVLTTRDFTAENGMLTPTLKIKRRAVLAEYEPRLDGLYRSIAAE